MTSSPVQGSRAAPFLFLFATLALLTGGCSGCDKDDGDGDASVDGTIDAFVPPPGCNDGDLDTGEVCDDGNNVDTDGCSRDCAVIDPRYICPTPGAPCIRIITCGNGKIEGDETCDDRNTVATDGCDADCHIQPGWTCTPVGVACVSTECGDGIVAGFEGCDDDNNVGGDGCDALCQLEEGSHCPVPGQPCEDTTCGDGVREGTEQCDDGNPEVGDGCDPLCHREPDCAGGNCVAVCGDSVKWAPEGCDDGNTVGGDGCSATCTIEPGFMCTEMPLPPENTIRLPVTYRDFIANCQDFGGGTGIVRATSNSQASRLSSTQANAVAPFGHPDFDCFTGTDGVQMDGNQPDLHMVADLLDAQGRPTRGTELGLTSSDASFAQWYRTTANVNVAISDFFTMYRQPNGSYRFPMNPVVVGGVIQSGPFFPLTNRGFELVDCNPGMNGVQACEGKRADAGGQNFFFTSEAHFWFEYKGDGSEVLDFTGDDDVWVFIDGRLVVDIGGVHGPVTKQLDLDDYVNNCDGVGEPAYCEAQLPLVVGRIYEAIVFQAERHVGGSNYVLTLAGFQQAPSDCVDDCGDGIVSSREACDLGDQNGTSDGYGGCTATCTFEPYCGDGSVYPGKETCDDGINLGGNASACSPGCGGVGASCGDGVVQTSNNEQCDDGGNVPNDGCGATCLIEID